MKNSNLIALLGLFLVGGVTQVSSAITIDLIFRDAGEEITSFGTATGAPATAAGNGTIQSVMEAAAGYWESAFADPFTLTVEYGWFPRSGSTTGTHRLLEEGGDPHRETRAAVVFDSDNSTPWFRDPTPAYANEFSNRNESVVDLGGGDMTTGVWFTGASGFAVRRDLLTTAMHEIGHALGLSSANDAFVLERMNNLVDVSAPLPFAGSFIPLNLSSAHLDLTEALMKSSRPNARRRLASEADILANAQISQFTQVNLNPTVPDNGSIDFDGDGSVDEIDLNMLLAVGPIATGVAVDEIFNGLFDLNGDGTIDLTDRDQWLSEAATLNGLGSPYLVGDANLDGVVDGQDFIAWNGSKFSGSLNWDEGDFNGDGVVDGNDFIAWNNNKFQSSDGLQAVPEPTVAPWLLLVTLSGSRTLGGRRRRG